MLNDLKQHAEAEVALQDAIRLKPNYPEAFYDLGYALWRQGKYVEAEAATREAIRLKPDDADAFSNLGLDLGQQHKWAEAEQAAREAIRLRADFYRANAVLGVVLSHQHKYVDALAVYRETLRLKPDDAQTYENLGEALVEHAESESKTPPWDEALAAFREAIRLKLDKGSVHSKLGVALVQQARAAGEIPPWDEAAEAFAQAIDLRKQKHEDDNLDDFCTLGQWDELFNRVLKLRPDEPALWIGRAQSLALRGQWAEAKADYAKVIYDRPVNGDETTDFAYLLLVLGDTDGYQKFCHSLVERAGDSKDVDESFQLARACGAGKCDAVDPSRIVEWARLGAQSRPEPWYPHVLGLAQFRAGQYEAAIENLKKSNALDWNVHQHQVPKAQNWLVLAMAHFRLGHGNEAQQSLATAKQIIDAARPKNPDEPIALDACDWMPMQAFLREAEALLKEPTPESKTTTTEN